MRGHGSSLFPLSHARERQNRRPGCMGPPLFIAGVSLTTLPPPHEREERKAIPLETTETDVRCGTSREIKLGCGGMDSIGRVRARV